MLKRISCLFLFSGLILSGCTLEQKLAKTFVRDEPPCRLLILEPEYLLKYNLKTYEVDGIDSLDEFSRDSILLENSLFLNQLSDSVVIRNFLYGFINTLKLYRTVIIPEGSVDTMMQNGGMPYILNIAQFSLEEFLHPYSSEEAIYDEVLVVDGFDVNAINFNIWIELGRMNTETKNKVLFASDYLTDDINGVFKQNLFTGKVIFDYTIDTITVSKTYQFAREFGETSAAMVYDHLLNEYIRENLSENYPFVPYYYHYNPSRKILYSIDESQRILELESY